MLLKLETFLHSWGKELEAFCVQKVNLTMQQLDLSWLDSNVIINLKNHFHTAAKAACCLTIIC